MEKFVKKVRALLMKKYRYVGQSFRFSAAMPIIKRELEKRSRLTIVDAGCGSGHFLRFLKNSNLDMKRVEVFCIDIDEKKLKKIRLPEKYKIVMDLQKIRAVGIKADVVVSFEVLEHLQKPEAFLKGVKKILKKDGVLIITTPNLASFYNRIALLCGYQPLPTEVSSVKDFGKGFLGDMYGHKLRGHVRVFTLKALKEFVEYCGYSIHKVEGIPVNMNVVGNIFTYIPSLSGSVMLELHQK